MNTQTATTMKTVADLIAHVVANCTEIDAEVRFREMLDESYDFEAVRGPFAYLRPSRVLEEMLPTDYRVMFADYTGTQDEWREIEGNYYDEGDVENAVESFMDEIRDDLTALEDELEEDGEVMGDDERGDLTAKIAAMESRIAELERYTF